MQRFCPHKLAEHRLEQARTRWPLLRGCPNTNAIRLVGYLDMLSLETQLMLVRQFSELEAIEDESPSETINAQKKRLSQFPQLEAYFNDIAEGGKYRGIGKIPVKTIAGVRKDEKVGGIEGWADTVGMTAADLMPPEPHAVRLDDLVPVAPRKLRKRVARLMAEKFGAEEEKQDSETSIFKSRIGETEFFIMINYVRRGGYKTHQFDYYLRFRSDGASATDLFAYENILRVPGSWDYITEDNVDQSVKHLGELIVACAGLLHSAQH